VDVHLFDAAVNIMGLHTSWAKTKIQNVASRPSSPSCVISGFQVEEVDRFTYLGSDVDSSGYCTPEILSRIGLASSIMWIVSGGRVGCEYHY